MTYGTIIFATLMMFLIGFSVIIALDSYTDKKRKKLFVVIISMVFILTMQNFIENWLTHYYRAIPWRTFVAIVGYSVRPAILVLYAHLIYPKMKHIIAWSLVGVNAVLHSTAFYSHLVFYIADFNGYQGGPLHHLCLIVSSVLLVYLVVLIILKYKKEKVQIKEIVFHFFWILIIIAGVVADILWNEGYQCVDYQTVATVGVSVLSYIWLHQQFVQEYENNFLAGQRIAILQKQIQPHFIYNALNTIQNMEGNPEKTQNAIADFAGYIRGNLAVLEGQELIPFTKEVELVKDYISIQQMRFPDHINVVYEITDDDFSIPPLSMQILVENAINHGITVRYEPGTITISSKRENNRHVITVSDDGVGFDTSILKDTDRVGLRAVKNRLEYYLDGTITVESEIGKGTKVTIIIPCSPPPRINRLWVSFQKEKEYKK